MSHLRSFTILRACYIHSPTPKSPSLISSALHQPPPRLPIIPKRTNYNVPILPADALPNPPDEPEGPGKKSNRNGSNEPFRIGPTAFKMFEAALTTFASVGILGAVGYGYTVYYKRMVL